MLQNLARGLLPAFFALAATAAEPPPALKVAFVYVSPIGEAGWSYQHDQGRRAMEQALGPRVRTTVVESVAEGPDAERVIRNFVQEGCKLVFTPSFGFMEPTIKVARTAPDVIFMNGTGYKTAPNVGVYNARYYEGRYLEGVIAGRMSRNGVVGYVGAFPIPEVLQGLNAFTLGLRSVNPTASVKLIWVNAWYDPGKEREAANALLKLGADTLAYATSGVAIVTTGEEKGAWTLGYYSDMSRFGPRTHLTSVVQTWGRYYVSVVEDVLAGRWKSGSLLGGLREGLIAMAPLNPAIPAPVREQVAELERDIVSGKRHPFAGPIVDQSGRERIAAGKVATDAELGQMNWLVQGIEGSVPSP